MQRCSEKAFAMCPHRHGCGTIHEATFTDDSECAEFNRRVDEMPMTNADRIRAMNDRELAWFLAEKYAHEAVLRLRDSGHEPTATEIKALTERLYYPWVRWLKQPVMEKEMVNLENIVDLDAQTKANNEAMRKVIAFMVGGEADGK